MEREHAATQHGTRVFLATDLNERLSWLPPEIQVVSLSRLMKRLAQRITLLLYSGLFV